MPGIIEQIQMDALDPKVSVTTLLHKVKLAATKLRLEKVESWVDQELKGYNVDVPDYRKVAGVPRYWHAYQGWQYLHGDAEVMKKLRTVPIGMPIASIESQIANKSQGMLLFDYPPDILKMISESLGMPVPRAGAALDPSSSVAIVQAVRTLVLEWAMELEKAGITGSGISFTPQDQAKAKSTGTSINIGLIGTFAGNLGSENISGDVIAPNLAIEKVRDFINQVKPYTGQLIQEGVDGDALTARIEALEKALADGKPSSAVAHLLTEIKNTVEVAAGKLVSNGVLSMLNQIFGTGVPMV